MSGSSNPSTQVPEASPTGEIIASDAVVAPSRVEQAVVDAAKLLFKNIVSSVGASGSFIPGDHSPSTRVQYLTGNDRLLGNDLSRQVARLLQIDGNELVDASVFEGAVTLRDAATRIQERFADVLS